MNTELISNIISFISAFAGVVAAIIAAIELNRSRKANEERAIRERKEATINAYNNLQNQVLDKLVLIRPDEVGMVIENIHTAEFKDAYNDYKALIARCEHFAVGINEHIYDFDVFYELSGEHLVYLYKKVKPIIMYARKNCTNSVPFHEFEEMIMKLEEMNRKREKINYGCFKM